MTHTYTSSDIQTAYFSCTQVRYSSEKSSFLCANVNLVFVSFPFPFLAPVPTPAQATETPWPCVLAFLCRTLNSSSSILPASTGLVVSSQRDVVVRGVSCVTLKAKGSWNGTSHPLYQHPSTSSLLYYHYTNSKANGSWNGTLSPLRVTSFNFSLLYRIVSIRTLLYATSNYPILYHLNHTLDMPPRPRIWLPVTSSRAP